MILGYTLLYYSALIPMLWLRHEVLLPQSLDPQLVTLMKVIGSMSS